ncbi:hypothetical protein [Terasakiella sp. SH-1]|uniref:hypothetical protein n=1 Tax=Terasakiella sp. SH-1 TaxID=2560057 RepID=UPI001073728B|nr:hypothetical protein [Terasakiella sp. SH-1]
MADIANKTNAATDCILKETIDTYVGLSTGFSAEVGSNITAGMTALFIGLGTLWIMYTIILIALGRRNPQEIALEIIYIIIAGALLQSNMVSLVSQGFTAIMDLVGNGASMVFKAAVGPSNAALISGEGGMTGLVCSTEKSLATVFGIAMTIFDKANALDLHFYLYAILLVLPYILIFVLFVSKTVVTVFRALFIATIFPYLVMAFGSGFLRAQTKAGVNTLIATFLVFMAATISVGLTIYGVNILATMVEIEDEISILNPQYLTILILGWAGSALMTEGIGLANSITGSSLSNTAAGVMTAGVMGTGAAIASKTMSPAKMAMGAAGGVAGVAVSAAAHTVANHMSQKSEMFDKLRGAYNKGQQYNRDPYAYKQNQYSSYQKGE